MTDWGWEGGGQGAPEKFICLGTAALVRGSYWDLGGISIHAFPANDSVTNSIKINSKVTGRKINGIFVKHGHFPPQCSSLFFFLSRIRFKKDLISSNCREMKMFTTKVSMGCLRRAFGIATKNSLPGWYQVTRWVSFTTLEKRHVLSEKTNLCTQIFTLYTYSALTCMFVHCAIYKWPL